MKTTLNLLLAASLCFLVVRILPGNVAYYILGDQATVEDARGDIPPPAVLENLECALASRRADIRIGIHVRAL